RQHVARDAEVLDGAGQREGVRRDDADVALDVDEGVRIEVLRVDDGAVDVGENLEFIGAADVVAVGRGAPGDDLAPFAFPHLAGREGLDHAGFFRHPAYPFIAFDSHRRASRLVNINRRFYAKTARGSAFGAAASSRAIISRVSCAVSRGDSIGYRWV